MSKLVVMEKGRSSTVKLKKEVHGKIQLCFPSSDFQVGRYKVARALEGKPLRSQGVLWMLKCNANIS